MKNLEQLVKEQDLIYSQRFPDKSPFEMMMDNLKFRQVQINYKFEKACSEYKTAQEIYSAEINNIFDLNDLIKIGGFITLHQHHMKNVDLEFPEFYLKGIGFRIFKDQPDKLSLGDICFKVEISGSMSLVATNFDSSG